MIVALSWLSVVLILGAYASSRPRLFHWANVTPCVPVCLPAALTGAYPSVAISLAFGAIGAWSLRK